MNLQEASVEEDRWSSVEVLIWIATRSRRFMDALSGLPLFFAEDRLWRLQRENHSPHPMNLSNALLAFREEVERGRGAQVDAIQCMIDMIYEPYTGDYLGDYKLRQHKCDVAQGAAFAQDADAQGAWLEALSRPRFSQG